MADEKDPAVDALKQIVEITAAALLAAPGEETEFNLITGMLENVCTFAVALNVNPMTLAFMFSVALSESEERVARVKAAHRAQAAQVGAEAAQAGLPAPPAPQGEAQGANAGPQAPAGAPNAVPVGPQDTPLTEAQVREILGRLKGGVSVN